MRVTTHSLPAGDAGTLSESESTYEWVSGTDSESMADSLASLDPRRSDHVHGLVGNQAHDDGSAIQSTEEDIRELPGPSEPAPEERENSSTTTVDTVLSQDDEPDSDEEARSRSSLEYTQQSLGAPTMPTPDARNNFKRRLLLETDQLEMLDDASPGARLNKAIQMFWELEDRFHTTIVEGIAPVLGMLAFGLVMVYLSIWLCPQQPQGLKDDVSAVATVTTTTTALIPSIKASSAPKPGASSGGVGLIPLQDARSDQGLFGSKKPVVSFTPQAQGDILVHVPGNVKVTWLSKGCLTVTASRGGEDVDTIVSPVEEGILIKFLKKETYGVVNLELAATCRPKVRKVVKVHFGKGIMEEAFEMSKDFAHGLTELVPAAAQEAERRFEGARRSLNTASGSLGHNVLSASDSVIKSLGMTLATARQLLDRVDLERFKKSTEGVTRGLRAAAQEAAQQAARQAAGQLPLAQDIQDQLRLGVLDAQVSAKTWWLRVTGREEEGADYQSKARDFVAKKRAAAKGASRARHAGEEGDAMPQSWSRMLRKHNHCKGTSDRGRRRTHQCEPVA